MDPAFVSLIEGLEARSVRAYLQSRNQLVVTRQAGAPWPDQGNSFRVTRKQEVWYVCTWSPVCYRVPAGTDLVGLCTEFVDRGESAQARIPPDLVARFALTELTTDESSSL
jgi:hypothetical protein